MTKDGLADGGSLDDTRLYAVSFDRTRTLHIMFVSLSMDRGGGVQGLETVSEVLCHRWSQMNGN